MRNLYSKTNAILTCSSMQTFAMRHVFLFLFTLLGFTGTQHLSDVHIVGNQPLQSVSIDPQIIVEDFLVIEFKEFRTDEGKKIKWTQRLALHLVQKKLARQLRQGKIEVDTNVHTALKASAANKTGRLSLIFSIIGLLVLVIPYGNIFGFGLTIAGLVLGIIGIRRDENKTMAILGTVFGGISLLLYLIFLLAIAAFFVKF